MWWHIAEMDLDWYLDMLLAIEKDEKEARAAKRG